MIDLQFKHSKIDMYLSILKSYIMLQNSNLSFDINKYCEDFVLNLLNLTYGHKLINLNIDKTNHEGVDLGDYQKRICVQVTSDNSYQKINDSLTKFNKY